MNGESSWLVKRGRGTADCTNRCDVAVGTVGVDGDAIAEILTDVNITARIECYAVGPVQFRVRAAYRANRRDVSVRPFCVDRNARRCARHTAIAARSVNSAKIVNGNTGWAIKASLGSKYLLYRRGISGSAGCIDVNAAAAKVRHENLFGFRYRNVAWV